MNNLDFQQGFALFEIALTCAIILIYLCERLFNWQVVIKRRFLFAMILINVFLWPLSFLGLPLTLSLAGYVRGGTGDLSIVTLFLLWSYFFIPHQPRTPFLYQIGIILVALFLYSYSLKSAVIDPYAWGYGSLTFLVVIIAVNFCMWLAQWNRIVIIYALSILAWCYGLHESTNLWDYLLDPFLVLWCLIQIMWHCIKLASLKLSVKMD